MWDIPLTQDTINVLLYESPHMMFREKPDRTGSVFQGWKKQKWSEFEERNIIFCDVTHTAFPNDTTFYMPPNYNFDKIRMLIMIWQLLIVK